jgi:hypothetical protein
MKNLEKFELSDSAKSKCIGGLSGTTVKTSDEWETDDGCTAKKSDSFEDCNNDGIWNPGESGSETVEIVCS